MPSTTKLARAIVSVLLSASVVFAQNFTLTVVSKAQPAVGRRLAFGDQSITNTSVIVAPGSPGPLTEFFVGPLPGFTGNVLQSTQVNGLLGIDVPCGFSLVQGAGILVCSRFVTNTTQYAYSVSSDPTQFQVAGIQSYYLCSVLVGTVNINNILTGSTTASPPPYVNSGGQSLFSNCLLLDGGVIKSTVTPSLTSTFSSAIPTSSAAAAPVPVITSTSSQLSSSVSVDTTNSTSEASSFTSTSSSAISTTSTPAAPAPVLTPSSSRLSSSGSTTASTSQTVLATSTSSLLSSSAAALTTTSKAQASSSVVTSVASSKTTALPVVSQISDGQIQATAAATIVPKLTATTSTSSATSSIPKVSQISDGQIQATTAVTSAPALFTGAAHALGVTGRDAWALAAGAAALMLW